MSVRILAPLAVLCGILGGASTGAEPLAFHLSDARGGVHTEAEVRSAKATVLFFLGTECPLSNRYIPEINRISREYSAKGFVFFAVNADPSESAEVIRAHDEAYALEIPTLRDPEHVLVRQAGAIVTPEVAVVTSDGGVRYVGRIDDRAVDFGKVRLTPKRADLRLALEELLGGKPVSLPVARSIGCAIPGVNLGVKP